MADKKFTFQSNPQSSFKTKERANQSYLI